MPIISTWTSATLSSLRVQISDPSRLPRDLQETILIQPSDMNTFASEKDRMAENECIQIPEVRGGLLESVLSILFFNPTNTSSRVEFSDVLRKEYKLVNERW